MKFVFPFIFIVTIIFGFVRGTLSDVVNSILSESGSAIELGIILAGGMAFWGGIMKICEKSGLSEKISIIFFPILKWLFKGIDKGGKAFRLIVMNITSNLLGLGNAATPLGIEAMKELKKEENSGERLSENGAVFVMLNIAYVQLLPTTTAMIRLNKGSSNPFEIIPCVIFTSSVSSIVGILAVKLTGLYGKRSKK